MYKLDIETNAILDRESLGAVQKKRVPEGALYFEGVVSDGNKNRNGYIIDSEAWFFDKNKSVKDFLKTGSVLFNHDSEKPIGRPLSFDKNEDGTISVTGFVYDDAHTNGAIGRGLILGLSTGHITHEAMFENEKGDRITEDEFWKKDWAEILSNDWTMVVTKAEIVEFSFVTTRSNRASVLANRYAESFKKDPGEVETLFFNHRNMKVTKNDTEEVVETPVEVTPEEIVETPVEAEAPAEEVVVETPVEVVAEENSVDYLKNEITSLKNHLTTLENNLKADYKNKLDEAITAIRTEERNTLAAVVTNGSSEVKTFKDVMAKHAE